MKSFGRKSEKKRNGELFALWLGTLVMPSLLRIQNYNRNFVQRPRSSASFFFILFLNTLLNRQKKYYIHIEL